MIYSIISEHELTNELEQIGLWQRHNINEEARNIYFGMRNKDKTFLSRGSGVTPISTVDRMSKLTALQTS